MMAIFYRMTISEITVGMSISSKLRTLSAKADKTHFLMTLTARGGLWLGTHTKPY